MRLLITGGAGTLGRDFIKRYADDPDIEAISVIDNFVTSQPENVPIHPRVSVTKGSIADVDLVKEAFESFEPTVVLHAAASYADPGDWEGDVRTNVEGTLNVLRASDSSDVRRLVNLQTVLCYGKPDSLPVTEDAPLRPHGSYAISKVAGEQFVLQSGLNTVSLRVGSVLSEGLAIGPIPAFYKRLKLGQASTVVNSVRDFLDPEDFNRLLRSAVEEGAPTGVFNVSTGVGVSMVDLYRFVSKSLNIDLEPDVRDVPLDDVPAVVLDSARARLEFNWKVTRDWRESVTGLLGWYDLHGVGSMFSHLRSGVGD